jgi:hypothetical protein
MKSTTYINQRTSVLKDYHQRRINFYQAKVRMMGSSQLEERLQMKLKHLEQSILQELNIRIVPQATTVVKCKTEPSPAFYSTVNTRPGKRLTP